MAIITSSEKSQEFVWDFAVDGGGVGSINMGDFIPQHAVIWFGFIKVITTITSGGGAFVSIGFVGNTGALVNPVAYPALTIGVVVTGNNLPLSPVNCLVQEQLQITFSGATVTAGKIVYSCRYTEWDI